MTLLYISGDQWITHILEKLGIDSTRASRVVIDARVGAPLVFHITYFGTDALLDVRPPEANEVQIHCGREELKT